MAGAGNCKMSEINSKINRTRDKLNELINKKMDNILSPDVLRLSQALDVLLVEYVKNQKKLE